MVRPDAAEGFRGFDPGIALRHLGRVGPIDASVPRLADVRCFLVLDPARLGDRAREASSIKGAARYGRPVHPRDMPSIDLVVSGAAIE